MLPSLLGRIIISGLQEYLDTGWGAVNAPFAGKITAFSRTPGGFVKGPYLSLQLPFRPGQAGRDFFPNLQAEHEPFLHQERAWRRLSGERPRSTLVATGTGSGKTECFLYPILDALAQRRPAPGVKAIIIYPMNALATDQAGRIARLIHGNPKMAGLRAGLYIGDPDNQGRGQDRMTPTGVITDRQHLRQHPPDLLLTNYKMLDYLLLRPGDQQLWKNNEPGTLSFLVVDELHTFDGAQGTDLALLIRRLRARLTGAGLVCVGTSATLGGPGDAEELRRYASQLFAAEFDDEAIISEDRLSMTEFVGNQLIAHQLDASGAPADVFDVSRYPDMPSAIEAWAPLFFPDAPTGPVEDPQFRRELGTKLKQQLQFHNLLRLLEKQPRDVAEVASELARTLPRPLKPRAVEVLDALVALVAWARDPRTQPGKPTLPFLHLRMQLWARELRRMVSRVCAEPDKLTVVSADDRDSMDSGLFLPMVQCGECHGTGWVGRIPAGGTRIDSSLPEIYQSFFGHHTDEILLFPGLDADRARSCVSGLDMVVCEDCGNVQVKDDACAHCGKSERVKAFRTTEYSEPNEQGVKKSRHMCPFCGATESLILFGARATTLSAVAIQHAWATRHNDDRRIIAFSDSVQDAAHRAGFIAARTWHNNVRMAILQAATAGGREAVDFQDLMQDVSAFWLDGKRNPRAMDPERFVVEFIGPNMLYLSEYEKMIADGTVSADLLDLVKKRLQWEVFSEFTYNARVGRSLERVGCAALSVKPEVIETACALLAPRLREQFGITHLSDREVGFLVWGICLHAKQRGGVAHPFLDAYVRNGATEYLLHRMPFLPGFSKYARRPMFARLEHARNFEAVISPSKRTWYDRWTARCLQSEMHLFLQAKNAEQEINRVVFSTLVETGVFQSIDGVFALAPANLFISADTVVMTTPKRDYTLMVPAAVAPLLEGMPALDPGCDGKISSVKSLHRHWLASVYRSGEIARVIAAEHTGMLERDVREALENRFNGKTPYRPHFENFLSATPTLEMGIDIVNLSSVLLCQVPPGQSNYLQRIGRAGRRDGNAISLTIANGEPHDLYFFAQPLEMMTGRIAPPGVYLNASMVLKRQLLATCFDHWARNGSDDAVIPHTMKDVLGAVEKGNEKRFPYTLFSFVQPRRQIIFDSFLRLLPDMEPGTKEQLREFLFGSDQEGGIEYDLLQRVSGQVQERKSLKDRIHRLRAEIDRLRRTPQDEAVQNEIESAQKEKDGLLKIIEGIEKKITFNFLTDEGLLPNYAFPESGVTLRSVITKRSGKGGDSAEVYEYERAAHVALSEFAPESRFYATGRRVEIDQIDLRVSEMEEWRFCPSCTHAEKAVTGDAHPVCPVCNDSVWADTGQKMMLVRLRQVQAHTSDKDSRILDDSEDRQAQFFQRHLLPDFQRQDIEAAYAIDSPQLPFGFEFIRHVTLREVNFGKYGGFGVTASQVAGKTAARPGFTVCRECGMVQKGNHDARHSFSCRGKSQDPDKFLIKCLYLYREFVSEGLRILLPKTRVSGDPNALPSMIAALQLGLKLKFGGKVDHLRVTDYEEKDAADGLVRRYMLLYDSVPGGTGYLHQLLREPSTMMEVFRLARDRMVSCECAQNPDKDGCYQCLFAYRTSHGMEMTSRRTAVSLLSDILEQEKRLVPIDTIGSIRVNPLFDSELEARFIEALKKLATEMRREIVRGKTGYHMEVSEEVAYWILPQADLGPGDGVMVQCRPDFLIVPEKSDSLLPPIAVFLDGFQYHRNRLTDDSHKRMALVKSGNYLVWNLTWEDVDGVLTGKAVLTDTAMMKYRQSSMDGVTKKLTGTTLPQMDRLMGEPLQLLMELLRHPVPADWETAVFARTLGIMQKQPGMDTTTSERWPSVLRERLADLAGNRISVSYAEDGAAACRIDAVVMHDAIARKDTAGLFVALTFEEKTGAEDPDVKAPWKTWLASINQLQFLPNACWTTQQGLEKGLYDAFFWRPRQDVSMDAAPSEWETVMQEALVDAQDGLKKLVQGNIPVPRVGFELVVNSAVVAEAELAWPEQKLAVLRLDQAGSSPTLAGLGWKVVLLGDHWSEEVISLFSGGKKS